MPKKAIQRTQSNEPGSGLQPFERPLEGKLNKSDDPCLIGRKDFVELKNLRYNDTGIEGVRGMSSVATGSLGLPPFVYGTQAAGVRNGHHFHKDFPATEDHIMVQAVYAGTTDVNCLFDSDSAAAIPNADTYTQITHSLSSTATTAHMTTAPGGNFVLCDGEKNYIWSGDEHRLGAALTTTAVPTTTLTNPVNVTDRIVNSSTSDVVTIGVDAYTMALYHFDGTDASTTITDSSGRGHTGSCVGNAQLDTAYNKFGTASLLLDGTGDYVTVPDSADFDFGTGDFTVDAWVRFNASPSVGSYYTIFSQYQDASNYIFFGLEYVGAAVYRVRIANVVSGNYMINVYCTALFTTARWYHFAFVRSGAVAYIFVDGLSKTLTGTQPLTNDTGSRAAAACIGGQNTGSLLNGWIDELRISKGIARWTADFASPSAPYSTTSVPYLVIGSTRPLQGIKAYVNSGNSVTATLTTYGWTGSAWSALTVTDNTSGLSTTGTVTWSSTVSTSKLRYYEGLYLYWYYLTISAGEAQVYMVTTTPVFQEYVDSWCGELIPCVSALNPVYADYTINSLSVDFGVFGTDTDTYIPVGGWTSASYMYFGFMEKTVAIKVSMAAGYVNAAAAVMTVDYWNGSSWVSVNGLIDGTAVSGAALAKSGVVSWNYDPSVKDEQKQILSGTKAYYYYRMGHSAAGGLTANTSIDCIQGIPAPTTVKPFTIPVQWQDRLWFLNEINDRKNLALGSAADLPESMNGTDSVELYIGDDTEIVAATTMFTRFGEKIYDNLLVCKKSATHLIDGFSPETFRIYTLSDSIGCVAPHTMKRCDVNYELDEEGASTHVCIWQAAHGIVMTDGNTIKTISDDIENYFDPEDSNYIAVSLMSKFYGFYDKMKQEYHWLFGTGSDTTLTKELVYDIRKKKWYEMQRSTYYLQCGFPVTDSYGFGYTYGGTTAGYLYRLEYGGTWAGTNITYNFKSSDTPLANTMMYEAEARKIKLIAVAKTSAEEVTITWYTDGATSGTALQTINQTKSGRRYYDAVRSFTAKGVTHQYDVTVTTDNGFDPLMMSGMYRPTRPDIISKSD